MKQTFAVAAVKNFRRGRKGYDYDPYESHVVLTEVDSERLRKFFYRPPKLEWIRVDLSGELRASAAERAGDLIGWYADFYDLSDHGVDCVRLVAITTRNGTPLLLFERDSERLREATEKEVRDRKFSVVEHTVSQNHRYGTDVELRNLTWIRLPLTLESVSGREVFFVERVFEGRIGQTCPLPDGPLLALASADRSQLERKAQKSFSKFEIRRAVLSPELVSPARLQIAEYSVFALLNKKAPPQKKKVL